MSNRWGVFAALVFILVVWPCLVYGVLWPHFIGR